MFLGAPSPLGAARDATSRRPLVVAAALTLAASGCGEDCVEVSTTCTPLYAPSFQNVFERTLVPTCAAGESSCHGPGGGRGGLVFAEQTAAHAALVGVAARDGGTRVIPGDPGCSALVVRLESDEPDTQMPPGAPLSEAERCSVVRWIADGALP